MTEPLDLPTIWKALFEAQGEFPAIAKTNSNDFFNSKYASFKDEKQAIDPILRRHGLMVFQALDHIEGKPSLRTCLVHAETGEAIVSETPLVLAKSDPQALGSATSYQKRYAYEAILGLITTDDDGNSATHADPKALKAAHERVREAAKRAGKSKADCDRMFQQKYGTRLDDSADVAAVEALADYLTERAVEQEMAQ
jgi:hypothetical protein